MAYEGSTQLASGIVQRNGNDFPLVHASAVQVDDDDQVRLDDELLILETAVDALLHQLPDTTAADNGKLLGVANGVYALISLPHAEEARF